MKRDINTPLAATSSANDNLNPAFGPLATRTLCRTTTHTWLLSLNGDVLWSYSTTSTDRRYLLLVDQTITRRVEMFKTRFPEYQESISVFLVIHRCQIIGQAAPALTAELRNLVEELTEAVNQVEFDGELHYSIWVEVVDLEWPVGKATIPPWNKYF